VSRAGSDALVVVVAGHDPTGGAGVDADARAARSQGVAARCVVTARTRQDGRRVHALGARPVADWLSEARAALAADELPPRVALKAGLLPGAEHVRAFAELCAALPRPLPVVVDPVLAASGGERFLDADGVAALLAELVPRGVVLTPNLPEAAELCGRPPAELAAGFPGAPDGGGPRLAAARELVARGASAVVLKGGHGSEDPVRELVLERGREPVWLEHPRVPGASLHGSGCRFASALAAGLARGRPLAEAAARAGAHVAELLRAGR